MNTHWMIIWNYKRIQTRKNCVWMWKEVGLGTGIWEPSGARPSPLVCPILVGLWCVFLVCGLQVSKKDKIGVAGGPFQSSKRALCSDTVARCDKKKECVYNYDNIIPLLSYDLPLSVFSISPMINNLNEGSKAWQKEK